MRSVIVTVYILITLLLPNLSFSCPCCPYTEQDLLTPQCLATPPEPYSVNIEFDFQKKSENFQLFVEEKGEEPFEITHSKPFIKNGNANPSFKIVLCNKENLLDSLTIDLSHNYLARCKITSKINCAEIKK